MQASLASEQDQQASAGELEITAMVEGMCLALCPGVSFSSHSTLLITTHARFLNELHLSMLCAHVCMCIGVYMGKSGDNLQKSVFFPSTMLFPVIELRSSGLQQGLLPAEPSHSFLSLPIKKL